MDGMTVRKKLAIAYVAAAIVFVAAVKLVALAGAPRILVLVAAVAAGIALFAYATGLKCPHCHGKAFSRRWLALCYVPRTCATCDREFFD